MSMSKSLCVVLHNILHVAGVVRAEGGSQQSALHLLLVYCPAVVSGKGAEELPHIHTSPLMLPVSSTRNQHDVYVSSLCVVMHNLLQATGVDCAEQNPQQKALGISSLSITLLLSVSTALTLTTARQ